MSDNDEEGELDPAMERVRRKLVRLLIFSTGIMVLGLAAVVVGIFYRVSQMDADRGPREPVPLAIAADALVSATADDDQLILVVGGASPRIEVRDLGDGSVIAVFTLEPTTGR